MLATQFRTLPFESFPGSPRVLTSWPGHRNMTRSLLFAKSCLYDKLVTAFIFKALRWRKVGPACVHRQLENTTKSLPARITLLLSVHAECGTMEDRNIELPQRHGVKASTGRESFIMP